MAYHYDIECNSVHYTPTELIDSNAKVIWDRSDSGIMFRKRLDGSFVINRAGNEALYDAITATTHCDKWFISMLDKNDNLVVKSIFNKRDIEYNYDLCKLTIRPRYYDPYMIDALIKKDFNIINENLNVYSVNYNENYQFEYVTYSASLVSFPGYTYDPVSMQWNGVGSTPDVKATSSGTTVGNTLANGWTFYSQINTYVPTPSGNTFNIVTTWFREVKLVSLSIDPNHDNPPPTGGSTFSFKYLETIIVNGINYNKYVRNVGYLSGNIIYNNGGGISWDLSDYYGQSEVRTITRARSLNEILQYFADQFNCGLSSEFFTNSVNPISYFDLSNLMIAQKSDCKFESGAEPTDPATLGIITFEKLMAQLWAMFQVTWVIENNILYIEHINFFKNNFSYETNTTVGIDLTSVYPICLDGTYVFSYDEKLPIRVKFAFMEAWNLDFVGTDIDYSGCLESGDTETISAELITTDIDPTYLDNDASNDGFCLFHCNKTEIGITGVYLYSVISQVGEMSKISTPNAHLSWANLHLYYWVFNSPINTGVFNGVDITFLPPYKRIKKQKPIQFPFCVENFDEVINNIITTTMGNGEVTSAEYSLKTGNMKIELLYE